MNDILWELIGSFTVGALCVSALSLTADRFGSTLAGALAGFPATIAASLFFLGLAEGSEIAAEAAQVVPLSIAIVGLFLMVYCLLLPRGLTLTLCTAGAVWILLTGLTIVLGTPSLLTSMSVLLMVTVLAYWVVVYRLEIPPRAGRPIKLRLTQLATRMFTGGSVVALSVYLGSISGPLFAGIMAAFPAVTVASLMVTYESGGEELSRSFAKSMMFSMMIQIGVYALSVRLFYPVFDVWIGTVCALTTTLLACLFWSLFPRFMRTSVSAFTTDLPVEDR